MRKKFISIILIVVMTFSFASCTKNEPSAADLVDSNEEASPTIDNPPILSILDTDTLPESITVTLKEVPEDSPSEEEQAKFDEAYELWYNDNTEKAHSIFMTFPKLYPDSCLNDDAQYYTGVCYNARSMPERALDEFSKVITEYPDSPLISSAYYNIGYTYYHLLESPELSYPYYAAFLENATINDANIVEYAIQTLSDETDINIIYNAPSETSGGNAESDDSSDESENESEEKEETEEKTEADSPSMEESNALAKALSYLDYTAFSHSGLIEQLQYEGFSKEAAKYGADNCGADWNEQAAKKAQEYIEYDSFSKQGLIDQLEYEGFSQKQAEYGAKAVGY